MSFSLIRKLATLLLLLGSVLTCQGDLTVTLVYDGDTFELENGEKVRLLGINAPEINQPSGDIAKDFLEKLVLEEEVRLEKDQTDKDDYGRLLRYVYVGDLFVNAEIVRKGYAEVRFYPPDTLYRQDFERLERLACLNEKGLWAFSVFQPPSTVALTKVEELLKPKEKPAPKEDVISWKDAAEYYGQIKTVEGTVVLTNNIGKACFLNFHPNWKVYFTAVIFASDFHKFPPNPEDYYLFKKVRVRGLIKEYKGKPEIILKSPTQIEIVE